MEFFNRIWQLKIQFHQSQTKIYQKLSQEDTSLKIAFSCESTVSTTPPSGSLTITGLPREDVSYLSTNYLPTSGQMKPSTVEFQAGYGTSLSVLLYGNIFQTQPNYTTPDYGITMKVMRGVLESQTNAYASVSMQGNATLRDVLATLASKYKAALDLDPRLENRVLTDYSFQGSLNQQILALRTYYKDMDLYLTNDKLVARTAQHHTHTRYHITPSSGLLGTPTPTPQGCVITTYLLPNLFAGDHLELTTYKIPQLNGIYKAQKVVHSGDTRGQEWKTTLTCLKAA